MNSRALLLIGSLFLTACASIEPFVMPPEKPFAYLKSKIFGSSGHLSSIEIRLSSDSIANKEEKRIFFITNKTNPPGYIKVPANERLLLHYYESVPGGRYCNIKLPALLIEGFHFVLEGGATFDRDIPFFPTRKCEMRLKLGEPEIVTPQTSTEPKP